MNKTNQKLQRIFVFPHPNMSELEKIPDPWNNSDEVLNRAVMDLITTVNAKTRIFAPVSDQVISYHITQKGNCHMVAHPVMQRVPIARVEATDPDVRLTSITHGRNYVDIGLRVREYSGEQGVHIPDSALGITLYFNPK